MQIVTPEQMKNIENRSESLGVSKAELMENAGAALAELIDRHCREDSTFMPVQATTAETAMLPLTGLYIVATG